ncbi:hypothetical protein BD410DRAFT_319915 [Rickenella mellea]|uniref:N-acetyltransferase domain-containing protein n=1 Tax=Rickenella mellea TaxID=50990 RepID=A0A4Y7PZU4_9AGAM|nr:hypothetical protein BD410DRAFT_319915 [Rickenella mellea]
MSSASTELWHLEIHPTTSEPVLRLPAPHDNIIITPPRTTDAPFHVTLINDPSICPHIGGAYPHTLQDAQNLLERNITRSLDVLARLEGSDKTNTFINSSPVNSLREVREDGTDQYLGNIHIGRHRWIDILDPERRDKLIAENFAKLEGDPGIVWDIGDHIAPSHQGRGIMTAAIQTIIEKWAIPRMNAHKFREVIQKDNQASVRVFQKNGFIVKEVVDDCIDIHESKGGGKVSVQVLEWVR